jgi:serine/threonine protein kinase/formylglycine-generating enzyme required for sulfatase activity
MATIDLYKVGQIIDQYTIVNTLHATQNSHLYVVQTKSVHKLQVLKLYAGINAANACATFTQQANLLLEFSSQPSIVDVLHIGTIVDIATNNDKSTAINERPFMVMPYYPQTLNDLLAVHHQKLSFVTSVHIINQVIDGLHAIHHLGIAHLDIKPQNIFLDESNSALIADFDNARVLDESPLIARFSRCEIDENMQWRATPDYASPEQIMAMRDKNINNNNISCACDMYSLALMWCRILTGTIPPTPVVGGELQHQLDNIAPQWAIDLINDLLNDNSLQRPNTSQCKLRMLTNMQAGDVNQTVCASAFETPPEIALIQQQIRQILLQQGWLSELDKDRLLLSYRLRLNIKENTEDDGENRSRQKESLQQIVDECQALLVVEKNLSSWFDWINYLQALLAKSGKHMSTSQYQQTLQVGRAARPDDPAVAERLLKQHFSLPRAYFGALKPYLLMVLVILSIFSYWAYESHTYKRFSKDDPVLNKSGVIANDKLAERPKMKVTEKPKIALLDINNTNNTDKIVKSNEDLFPTTGAYTLSVENANPNLHQSLSIQWVQVDVLPNIRIMATEVTNALFALCAKEGACRQVKQFSSASKTAIIDLPNHPRVNVDWYEITQQFIPWLNHKTQKRFSLPSYAQWQLISTPNQALSQNKMPIHCKNCNHSLARQYAGVTMPVKAINPASNNIYHILGNAQEWLNDCWQQRSADNTVVERCDQAMVAGGSWISKQSAIREQPISQLLKSAKTPTTGFRLIEWLHE